MFDLDINYVAVLVAALASIVVGAVYYSPPVLGKVWMKMIGMKPADAKKGAGMGYVLGAIAALITAYVLAHILSLAGAAEWMAALQTTFWVWLGFFATTSLHRIAWEKGGWDWWFLTNGNWFLTLLTMALVLTYWP